MKKALILILPLILLVSLACNFSISLPKIGNAIQISSSGNQVSQERQVSNFDQVDLRSYGNITITQGDEESLVIEAGDNIIDHLTSDVRGGKLILSTQDNYNFTNIGEIHYTLTVKDLKEIDLSGFGNITTDGLNTDSLEVRLSGSGNLKLNDLDARHLDLVISGFGSADVAGKVDSQRVRLTGSGNYNADDLQSNTAEITLSGFGGSTVWANESLDVTITGSGSVSYYGEPTVTQKITGFGRLDNLGSRE